MLEGNLTSSILSLLFNKACLWEAISVKSGTSSRLVIKKSIAKVEIIDW